MTIEPNRLTAVGSGLLLALLALPGIAAADAPANESDFVVRGRPELTIGRVSRTPQLEDFLDMQAPADLATEMTEVEGFIQQTPTEGEPISQRTLVYLGYDDTRLYAVFLAFDDQPKTIRGNYSRREDSRGDDIVEIQLDTFNDERRAYSFIVNPVGVQTDAIWFEGSGGGFDFTWDTVWESEGRITDSGYVVSLAIPFKSLRFPDRDAQTWGIVLARDIQRLSENTFWPRIDNRIVGRMNQAGILSGLESISPGRNFQVIPYATARDFKVLDDARADFDQDSFDGDAGVDAKWVIQDRLTLDLTANPDFSQVESDSPQVTVNQRFEVFFPEKRPFFLDNANFFQTPLNLLFTRRIADPRVGARLTGKSGNNAFGALVIDDEAPGEVLDPSAPNAGERARFDVFRYSRDLADQSNIGVLYTGRRFGNERNRVASVDSRLKFGDNWNTALQAVLAETEFENGEQISDQAYNAEVNRNGRGYNAHFHYREVGPDFVTQTGFINRTDVRNLHTDHNYQFWTEGDRLLSWGGALFAERIEDHDGQRLDQAVQFRMYWNFIRNSGFNWRYRDSTVHLRPSDFAALDRTTRFSTDSWFVGFSSQPNRAFSFDGGFGFGDGVNFVPPALTDPMTGEVLTDPVSGQTLFAPPSAIDMFDGNASLTWRPNRRLRTDLTYLYSQLEQPGSSDNVLVNQILRSRWSYPFSNKLSLRAILEYRRIDSDPLLTRVEERRQANADLLLTYLVNPWTAIYLGYNTNYRTVDLIDGVSGPELVRTEDSYLKDAEQVFFKISYLFRL